MRLTSLYLFLILITTSACGSKNNSANAVENQNMDAAAAMAQVVNAAAEKKDAPKVKPDTLDHSLKSSQEAVDWMKQSGHWDKYSKGIIPGIATQSLEYAEKLLRSRYPYFAIVDKGSMFVILYDKYGQELKAYKMACSRYYGHKHKFRDNRTPEGFFEAEGIYNSTDWKYTNDDGYTSPAKGVYGPRFIRLKTPVTRQVGIHGTNSPNSPGHRVSHGCIRLRNENILDLVKYAEKGMPIIVNPGPKDDAVNKKENCHVVMLNLGKIKDRLVTEAEAEEILKKQNGATAKDSTKTAADEKELELKKDTATVKEPAKTEEPVKKEEPAKQDEPAQPEEPANSPE